MWETILDPVVFGADQRPVAHAAMCEAGLIGRMRLIYVHVKQKRIARRFRRSIVTAKIRGGCVVYEFLYDLAWVEGVRADGMTRFFKVVTWFGYTTFYMIFLSIGYWLWSYRTFTRLAALIAISGLLNAYLKDFWQDPRPVFPPPLDPKAADSFGFPSGHAQLSVTLWIWLCVEMRKGWLWFVGVAMIGLICLSRLYLAVHDVEDILGGLAIPIMLLTLGHSLETLKFGGVSRAVVLSVIHIGISAIAAFAITHVLILDARIESVIVLMCFMPPSVATYLAVSQHQPDEAHGVAGFIFVSTCLTLVTLPVVLTYWATG